MGPHDNVVAVKDVLWPPEADDWLRSVEQSKKKNQQKPPALSLDSSPPPPRFDDVYVLYELMDTDLHQIIRSKQPLTDEHAQFFIYQLLRGLKYIHSGGVLHRDLKPSNLLVNASCDLKIADFGLARAVGAMLNKKKGGEKEGEEGEKGGEGEGEGGGKGARGGEGASSSSSSSSSNLPARPFLTEYVVTRWYRAPELLLGASDGTREGYGAAVDVWAAGCILAELLGRTPLFAGRDYIDQLQRIVALLGVRGGGEKKSAGEKAARSGGKESPEKGSSSAAGDRDDDSSLSWVPEGRARAYVAALPRPSSPPDWQALYPGASSGALDLLPRLLALDPAERLSVDDALAHEWLSPLADPEGEPVVTGGAVEALGEDAGCGGGGERKGKKERREAKRKQSKGGKETAPSSSSSSDSDDEGENGDNDDDENAAERLRHEALVEMMHYPSAKAHAERLFSSEKEGGESEKEGGRGEEASSSSSVEKAASGLAAVSLSADASSS